MFKKKKVYIIDVNFNNVQCVFKKHIELAKPKLKYHPAWAGARGALTLKINILW